MSYSQFLTTDRIVVSDGRGRIYTCDPNGSNKVTFPYWGFDPTWAWGGAAILFVDANRTTLWCSNVDGSGLYNLGVTGTWLTCPRLNLAPGYAGLYWVNSWVPSAGSYDLVNFGGGGYNIRTMLHGVDWGYDIHPSGDWALASGIFNGRFQLCRINKDGTGFSIPYRAPNASYPDARHPSFSPDGNWAMFQTGDLVGVDPNNAATYKTNAISQMYATGGGSQTFAAYAAPNTLLDCPSYWSAAAGNAQLGNSGIIYDFSAPGGSGVWAVPQPGWVAGGGVYGNPNGQYAQFGSASNNRCKAK